MTSYQKRKAEVLQLKAEVETLKKELLAKGNIFFLENKYLGVNKTVYGFVSDGAWIKLGEKL